MNLSHSVKYDLSTASTLSTTKQFRDILYWKLRDQMSNQLYYQLDNQLLFKLYRQLSERLSDQLLFNMSYSEIT
jgi:hypothetical protein